MAFYPLKSGAYRIASQCDEVVIIIKDTVQTAEQINSVEYPQMLNFKITSGTNTALQYRKVLFVLATRGFTLAELLIALTILGVIATFTIPKIINAQQNSKNRAVTKEIVAMLSNAAYQARLSGTLTTSTTMGDLTQYMNYIALDTSSGFDSIPTGSVIACSSYRCLRMHSGALLLYDPAASFGTTTGYVPALIDPDGRVTSQNDSFGTFLFYNGQVSSYGDLLGATYTPNWFSW